MTLYRLNDWEVNGYDDSEFQYAVYNSDTNGIELFEYGSTRYAGGADTSMIQDPTSEIVFRCQQILEDWLTKSYIAADKRATDTPETIDNGVRVKLMVPHKNQAKSISTTDATCYKCAGSGHWVNPRNSADKRTCFACNATGKVGKKTYTKVKSAEGKVSWVKFEAGTKGVLKRSMMYGGYYSNGYKQMNRDYLDCIVVCDDGREMKVPMCKLSLDREYISEAKARSKAEQVAEGLDFKQIVSGHGGWLTRNFAAEVMAKNTQQS